MPIEPGSGRWFVPYRKYLFCLACAFEHSHGSSDMTAVRLVPLRHFLGSVWLFLVEHMHSAFGALLSDPQVEIGRVTGSWWPDCVAVAAHWSMARFGGVAPSWHRHSTRTSIAHEAWSEMSLVGLRCHLGA